MRRTTTVRIEGLPPREALKTPDYTPAVPSEHDRLLKQLPDPTTSWAAAALVTVLRGVGAGHTFEPVAVTDAWIEDAETFSFIYLPPYSDSLAGIRRRRGDLNPDRELASHLGRRVDPNADWSTPDDPVEFAEQLLDDIGEPLGNIKLLLRFDPSGVGWWGTLDDALPTRRAAD